MVSFDGKSNTSFPVITSTMATPKEDIATSDFQYLSHVSKVSFILGSNIYVVLG